MFAIFVSPFLIIVFFIVKVTLLYSNPVTVETRVVDPMVSMRIRIHEAKPMRIQEDPDPDIGQTFK